MVRNAVHCLKKKPKKQLMATQQVICVRTPVKEGSGEIQRKQKNHGQIIWLACFKLADKGIEHLFNVFTDTLLLKCQSSLKILQ